MYKLVVVRNFDTVLSEIRGVTKEDVNGCAVVYINPEDAKKEGLSDGEMVSVNTKHGRTVVVKLRTDEGVPRGYLVMPLSILSLYLADSDDPGNIPVVEVFIRRSTASKPTSAKEIIDFMTLFLV